MAAETLKFEIVVNDSGSPVIRRFGDNARDATDDITRSVNRMDNAFGDALKTAMGFAAAYVGFDALKSSIASMVETGAEFEQTMATVGAVMRLDTESAIGAANMDRLTAAAREMGATTEHTATASAEALKFMAMAGWDAEAAITALPGLLDLATAGQMDLAEASDIVTDAMTAFGMEASEVGRFNDALAATFTRTNVNISTLGESFNYVAPIARSFGADVETTAAMLGTLGSAGIKGSMAGTALRTMFLKTGDAAKELGIEGANLTEVLNAAAKAQWDMNKVNEVFGKYASSATDVLIKNVKFTGDLEESIRGARGENEKLAETMRDTTKGAMNSFSSAVESLALDVFGKYRNSIKEAIKDTTSFIREHADTFLTLVDAGVKLAPVFGVGGAMYLGFVGLPVVMSAATATMLAFNMSLYSGSAAASLLLAAFAGWKIGEWLYDNFEVARLAGLAFVDSMMQGWINLKAGAQIAWEGIKAPFLAILSEMSAAYGKFISLQASLMEKIPIDSIQEQGRALREVAAGYQRSATGAGDFSGAVKSIVAERDKELKIHNSIIEEIRKEHSERKDLTMSVKDGTKAAVKGAGDVEKAESEVQKTYEKTGKEAEKAYKAAQRAAEKAAKEEERLAKEKSRIYDSLYKSLDKLSDDRIKYERRNLSLQEKETEKSLKEILKVQELTTRDRELIHEAFKNKAIAYEEEIKNETEKRQKEKLGLYEGLYNDLGRRGEDWLRVKRDQLSMEKASVEDSLKGMAMSHEEYDKARTLIEESYAKKFQDLENEKLKITSDFYDKVGVLTEESFAYRQLKINEEAQAYHAAGISKVETDAWAADEYQKLEIEKLKSSGDFTSGVQAGYMELGQTQIDWADRGYQVFSSFTGDVTNSFKNTLVSALQGDFSSLGDAWDSLWGSMLNTLIDSIAQMAAEWAANAIFEAAGSLFFHEGAWSVPGLKGDETPAVLQQGEMVIPKGLASVVREAFPSMESMSSFFDGFKQTQIGEFLNNIYGMGADTISNVGDALSGIVDSAKSGMSGAIDQVKGYLGFDTTGAAAGGAAASTGDGLNTTALAGIASLPLLFASVEGLFDDGVQMGEVIGTAASGYMVYKGAESVLAGESLISSGGWGGLNALGGAVKIGSSLAAGQGVFDNQYDNTALGVVQTAGAFTKYGAILSTAGEYLGELVGGSEGAQVGAGIGAGAGVGAAVGSVVPGPGTAIGAAVGAVIGGLASAFGMSNKKDWKVGFTRGEAGFFSPVDSLDPWTKRGGNEQAATYIAGMADQIQTQIWSSVGSVAARLNEDAQLQFIDILKNQQVPYDIFVRESHVESDVENAKNQIINNMAAAAEPALRFAAAQLGIYTESGGIGLIQELRGYATGGVVDRAYTPKGEDGWIPIQLGEGVISREGMSALDAINSGDLGGGDDETRAILRAILRAITGGNSSPVEVKINIDGRAIKDSMIKLIRTDAETIQAGRMAWR